MKFFDVSHRSVGPPKIHDNFQNSLSLSYTKIVGRATLTIPLPNPLRKKGPKT